MNGRHPIDELFAHTLRDAEAPPPPAVWEGIVRERDRAKRAAAKRRGRWGIGTLLLLMTGAAGYWALVPNKVADPQADTSVGATIASSGRTTDPVLPRTNTNPEIPPATITESRATVPSGDPLTETTHGNAAGSMDPKAGSERSSNHAATHAPIDPAADKAQLNAKGSKAHESRILATMHSDPNLVATKNTRGELSSIRQSAANSSAPADDPFSVRASGSSTGTATEARLSTASGVSISSPAMRKTPDEHLPTLTSRTSLLGTGPVVVPGTLLKGDTAPAYVLGKGQWWIAAQADLVALTGEWKGSGPEVDDLNQSETWQRARGIGVVFGRTWLNGWSLGMGLGVQQQRSRFLHREVEQGQSIAVIDTVWTGTPMGAQTYYTADLVETVVTEPGAERDRSATNTCTRLRIAPEIGYELVRHERLTVEARLAPTILMNLVRNGNTLFTPAVADTSDATAITRAVRPLNDASIDGRFATAFAISGGIEVRYRLSERFSLGVQPMFTYWLPKAAGSVPVLSMFESGGSLRLRYDFRHHERRMK